MSKKSESAAQMFQSGYNCAQSVFTAFIDETGFSREQALKLTTGFAGGMGKMQFTCGAVAGAYMVISALNGTDDAEDSESKEKTIALVKKFRSEFEKLHETTNCKELIGYDLNSEEEFKEAAEKGIFKNNCTGFVRDAVELLENKILA